MLQPEYSDIKSPQNHLIKMENRASLCVTAVQQVTAYDTNTVTLETAFGTLIISGEGLKVLRFSVESGEAEISGKMEYVQYREKKSRTGLWERLRGE